MRSLALLALTVGLVPVDCLAVELACPASITVEESTVDAVPPGWSVRSDTSPRYLAGVTFFDDDPAKQQSIAPTRDKAQGKDRVATWEFGSSDIPVWVACRYVDSGVTLSRALPRRYSQRSVTYGAGGVVTRIDCR